MVSTAARESKLKVFISYSRIDYAFADELVEGLEYDGKFEVSIDRHSIIEGEDWKARLGALIADADTIVFILSPESATSDVCFWEVERAHELSKRILPVLWRPLGNISTPARLAAINYVRFDEERSFMKGLKALVTSLSANIDWLREHTRLLSRAREWEEAGRSQNRLLSGVDITAAKGWVAERPKDAPEPTELHRTFIQASEAADTARRDAELRRQAELAKLKAAAELQAEKERSRRWANRVYAVTGSLLVMLVVIAGWQWFEASQQADIATAKSEEANKQRKMATQARDALDAQRQSLAEALKTVNASLCKEANKVTKVLGTASETAVWDSNFDLFWTLYWGPMIALESLERQSSGQSDVANAMIQFGKQLGKQGQAQKARETGLPRTALLELADGVAGACSEFTDES